MTKTLASMIKYYREKRGLSMRQLAEQAGISAPEIARIESGSRANPSIPILYNLAESLEIRSDELLEVAGWKKFRYSAPTLKLIEKGHIIAVCHSCQKKCGEFILYENTEMSVGCTCGKSASIYPVSLTIIPEGND